MHTVRYLFIAHLTSVTALLAAVILSFITTIGITEEIGDLGAAQWWRAVAVSIVRVPQVFHESLPYAVIIGSAVAFVALDRSREMTVLRTSGLRLGATIGMVLQAGIFWTAVHFLVGELLVAPAAQAEKQLKLNTSASFLSAVDDIWLIDGNNYVRIGSVSAAGDELRDLTLFTLDSSGDLAAISEAESARRVEEGWILEGVWRLEKEDSWIGRRIARQFWGGRITPSIIDSFITKPRQMSVRQLRALTGFLARNRQDGRKFELALWTKIAASAVIPLFMLTGLCFVSYRRQVSVGGAVGLSLLLTIGYYMLSQVVSQLTLANADIPLAAGVLGPPALWVAGTLAVLRMKEHV